MQFPGLPLPELLAHHVSQRLVELPLPGCPGACLPDGFLAVPAEFHPEKPGLAAARTLTPPDSHQPGPGRVLSVTGRLCELLAADSRTQLVDVPLQLPARHPVEAAEGSP